MSDRVYCTWPGCEAWTEDEETLRYWKKLPDGNWRCNGHDDEIMAALLADIAPLRKALEEAERILADVYNPAIRCSPAKLAGVVRRIEQYFKARAAALRLIEKTGSKP